MNGGNTFLLGLLRMERRGKGERAYSPFPSRQPTTAVKARDTGHQKPRKEHGDGATSIENARALGHLVLAVPRADHVLQAGIVAGLSEP